MPGDETLQQNHDESESEEEDEVALGEEKRGHTERYRTPKTAAD